MVSIDIQTHTLVQPHTHVPHFFVLNLFIFVDWGHNNDEEALKWAKEGVIAFQCTEYVPVERSVMDGCGV